MPTPSVASLAPPAQPAAFKVGPYHIIGRLGRGGMAEVLLAMQHDTDSGFKRLVVVKRLLSSLDENDPQFAQMFLDEARLGARLSHANIVQTYEVGQSESGPYLAMEFLDGQSLNQVQRRAHTLGRTVPVHVTLRIFCDVLDGLQHAHELRDFDGKPLSIVHRDVTPSNIFVKYDGTAKMVDFGIAKSGIQREKTRAGVIKGKLAYMAPEQLRDEPVTRSVDVWATGISLWETLAGERLFRGKNDYETMQAVVTREVPKLSARRGDVPAELDAIIADSLARDPDKRIPTAEAMRSRLEEVAFTIGKPLRRSDVASTMRELFGEVIEQNQKLVNDFLQRSAESLASGEVLQISTSASAGALHIESASVDPDRVSTSMPSATLMTASPVPSDGNSAVTTVYDETRVDAPPQWEGEPGEGAEAGGEDDAIDEDEARPIWHWGALAAAVLSLVGGSWYLLTH